MILHRVQKWRQEYGTDNIRKTFPTSKYFSLLKEYWPASIVGQSKDGSYVFVERIGCVDPKSLLHAVPPDELLRFHVYVMEGHERLYVHALLLKINKRNKITTTLNCVIILTAHLRCTGDGSSTKNMDTRCQ